MFIHVKFLGLSFYEPQEMGRMTAVVEGRSGTPWQYRLVMAHFVLATVRAFETAGVPRPVGSAFVVVRLIQNFLVFFLAVVYYRKLGLSTFAALIGVSLVAWGMTHSHYDNGMSFDTYTDNIIYLIAGLLILSGHFVGLIPLMLLAPFNRETSGCIPFMLLGSQLTWKPRLSAPRKAWWVFAITAVWYVAVIAGLRVHFGLRPYIVPTCGKSPILPLLIYNLSWHRTWVHLFGTLGLMPLLAVLSYRAFPRALRAFFWAIVPLWLAVHFPCAQAAETRLFLVPQIMVFVPGALLGLTYWHERSRPVDAPVRPEATGISG